MLSRRVFCLMTLASSAAGSLGGQRLVYPPTARGSAVDDYHGTPVPDPYRWLENVDSDESRAWVAAQNRVTFAWLEEIPERTALRARLTALWDYPRHGAPFTRAGRRFFFKNDGLQNQAVLYTQASRDAEPAVLLDPNLLSPDGTVALTITSVSDDGRRLAYGTAASGSDWNEIHVRDVATGRDLPDRLQWVKFSDAAWTHDGSGFFYSRYPEPPEGQPLLAENRNHMLYYHRLGTPQSDDILIYARPDQPEWGIGASVTEDGRYVILHLWLGTDRRNRVAYIDLGESQRPDLAAPATMLLGDLEASFGFIGNDGPVFYFQTDADAPRHRVIAIDTRAPARERWRTIIPQHADVLQSVRLVANTFVAEYLHDAHSCLRLHGIDGAPLQEVALPTLGSVSEITGRRADREMFYAFTSFLYPTTVFHYDFASARAEVFRAPVIAFDPTGYETRQVFYQSRDGTRIPMFLTMKRGLPRDSRNPTLLYGYGGFNINLTPAFSVSVLAWLELGGIYAVPNLRGGAEYGEEWHQAGMLERKQTVFDDFVAAAEYLIREGYTSTPKLAISGASNGGLLVGAALTQRPDLFGAALPAVGVLDMLRFHRFTIGWAWVTEYGSADSVAQFPFLYRYSPLHNLKPGTAYPATLITTADHDDRVVPGHSFKFAAALQAAQGGDAPVLIRIETKAGHGAGKPTTKLIEEAADRWAFLVRVLGIGRAPG